jgi:hypothetical protein
MFTNPGAPVMSLETFSRLLNRQLAWELIDPGQLRVTTDHHSFVTRDFVVIDNRVWLILKPELAGEFGLRVVSYGNGFLDLETKT